MFQSNNTTTAKAASYYLIVICCKSWKLNIDYLTPTQLDEPWLEFVKSHLDVTYFEKQVCRKITVHTSNLKTKRKKLD